MKEFITTFEHIKKQKPKNIRGFARDVALNMLSIKTKLPNKIKLFEKPRIQFLYLHHVFDDEINNFDKLLNTLLKYHSFISYSAAINKILTGKIDKPYISISMDDGFKNNLEAVKIMDKYGIKSCFFINPDTIGMKNFTKIKTFCREKLHFPPLEFMDWKDIDFLMKNGHEVGSHFWTYKYC